MLQNGAAKDIIPFRNQGGSASQTHRSTDPGSCYVCSHFCSIYFPVNEKKEKHKGGGVSCNKINLHRLPRLQMRRVWTCIHHHGKTCSDILPNEGAKHGGKHWESPSSIIWMQWQTQTLQAQPSGWQCFQTCQDHQISNESTSTWAWICQTL